jgi:NTP pyrophosphatase (non-canonical NTP hydrolase)
MKLTFEAVRNANRIRCAEKFHEIDSWSASDWGNAMAGEFGEVAGELLDLHTLSLAFLSKVNACDTIKKMLRQLKGDEQYQVLVAKLAKELADVVLYADLLSERLDINLGESVRAKFNEVSVKRNSDIRL